MNGSSELSPDRAPCLHIVSKFAITTNVHHLAIFNYLACKCLIVFVIAIMLLHNVTDIFWAQELNF